MYRILRNLTVRLHSDIRPVSLVPVTLSPARRMASNSSSDSIFQAIRNHNPGSVAVAHCSSGKQFTYGDLVNDVLQEQRRLQDNAGKAGLVGERIAFLVENSYDYVGAQFLVNP